VTEVTPGCPTSNSTGFLVEFGGARVSGRARSLLSLHQLPQTVAL
jgi:hypothetical protein